nr:polysaccharide pyruvyl transferase family protein [Cryobacterium sp. MLB-32]
MQVVITNAVLGNSGDAAILQGIREALISTGVASSGEISVHDSDGTMGRALYPEWSVSQQASYAPAGHPRLVRYVSRAIRRSIVRLLVVSERARRISCWRVWADHWQMGRTIREIRDADIVISSGGTYLVDHYNFSGRALELELAKAFGGKVVLWTQSMGPFQTTRSARDFAKIAQVVDAVFFRDEKSRVSWSNAAPLPLVSAVVADAAFAITPTVSSASACIRDSRPTAIISVREWRTAVVGEAFSFDSYAQAMREGAIYLLSKGWRCVALSTCQGVERYAINDSKTATAIFDGLDVEINSAHHTPSQLIRELEDAKLVVSTRMHLAILATIARVPVIAIAYEFKTTELFAALGRSANVTNIEDVSGGWIQDRVDALEISSNVLSDDEIAELSKSSSSPAIQLIRAFSLSAALKS